MQNEDKDDDDSDKEDGVVGNLQQQIRTQYDKGMLELRLQLVRMRTEYLNNINTQSTLIASCAVAMLSSGEIQAVSQMDRGLWSWFFNMTYMSSACFCLSCSIWVIYTSMNLINISIHSTLYGKSMAALTEADNIIELRMKEVRLVFVMTLGALFTATFSMLAEEASFLAILIGGSLFGLCAWHSSTSDSGTVAIYQRYTGLTVNDRFQGWQSVQDLMIPFGSPEHSSAAKYSKLRDSADPALDAFLGTKKKRQKGEEGGGQGGGEESTWAAARAHFADGALDEHGIATVIQRAVRAKRVRIQDREEGIHTGYLLKTPADMGPLHRQQLAASQAPAGAPSPNLTEVTPNEPHFAKFFVLDEKRRTLEIYADEESRRTGEAPKFKVRNVKDYALLRIKQGNAGGTTLALLPTARVEAANANKSWYIRAADEAQTNIWYGRFRAAGAEWKDANLRRSMSSCGHGLASGGSASFRSRFAVKTPEKPSAPVPETPPVRPNPGQGLSGSTPKSSNPTSSQPSDERRKAAPSPASSTRGAITSSIASSFRGSGQYSRRNSPKAGGAPAAQPPTRSPPQPGNARMPAITEEKPGSHRMAMEEA